MNDSPRYPDAEVQLTGNDGNAFGIMARVVRALRDAGATPADINQYQNEAMSGDYDHLLRTTMAWVHVS